MGRVESYGNAKASVGDTIRLKGIGSDIDGDSYVSGIKHVAENGTWTTLYDFGVDILQLQQDFDKQDVIPDAEEEQAQLVTMVSESGHSIIVDDEQNTLIITTADGNRILLDDENNSILIEDTNDNAIVMNDDAISIIAGRDLLIEANNKISLSAGDDITIDSQKSITIDASLDAQIKGTNTTIDAAASLDLTGNASTSLTSSAQTRITGALVTIN